MAALVTLAAAKQRCRVILTDEDEDLQTMIEQASAAVIDRVDNAAVTDLWVDGDTTPDAAKAATLEMVLYLYERDTTGNQESRDEDRGKLPRRVEMHLVRLNKPALA